MASPATTCTSAFCTGTSVLGTGTTAGSAPTSAFRTLPRCPQAELITLDLVLALGLKNFVLGPGGNTGAVLYNKSGSRRVCGRQGLPAAESSGLAPRVFLFANEKSAVFASLKNKRYLVRRARALRCRIRYSPESTRWAVALKVLRTHGNAGDNLYVRYLYWNDGAWHRNYNWLDNDFDVQNPAAVSATFFISPSPGSWLRGSFVYPELLSRNFWSCPC